MTNQSVARSMGPPYTTQVQFMSTGAGFTVLEISQIPERVRYAGKQRMGNMRTTNPQAAQPIG